MHPHAAPRDALFARLADLGIKTRTTDHEAAFSVSQSTALELDRIPGAHTKNLFLKDQKGALFLVVAKADTSVDLKSLQRRIGSRRLSFGKPELLNDVLGVEPGSVTAFAVMNDTDHRVRVVFDAALMTFDDVNCHPLENTATTTIARKDLFRFFRACGVEPEICNLET